ncbi:hypothetical protein G7074_20285 [Pedobacter sp. HDW13]|uniref:thiopeptide-type bacteriocin biosynthesis protein n=1 Tax=Pedobacter sp. HDW13 TaxID=2714940 RepID=UPI00140A45CF|nr:thiopeptide-type bacteriocin biosynthesis protein [Pedobacter sp. HDW13]QIL41395.1 hypothetical protein G7074_20285 [Pedobacter sp. HDW13]
MQKQNDKWLAVYIFYKGDADVLLKQLVYPLIQKWPCSWFFIRYWDGGDHIRLRLKAALSAHHLIVEELNQLSAQAEINVTKLQVAVYEPETDRYGNIQSMVWAERYFECSSVYVLNWIVKKEPKHSVSIQAIKLHLVLLFALKCDNATLINICNFFIAGWLPKLFNQQDPVTTQKIFWLNQFESTFKPAKNQILQAANQFWQCLDRGEINNDTTVFLSESIAIMHLYQKAEFKQEKLFQVITSFMHMNNNRLGISNNEEAYIIYIVIECLKFIKEKHTHQT